MAVERTYRSTDYPAAPASAAKDLSLYQAIEILRGSADDLKRTALEIRNRLGIPPDLNKPSPVPALNAPIAMLTDLYHEFGEVGRYLRDISDYVGVPGEGPRG